MKRTKCINNWCNNLAFVNKICKVCYNHIQYTAKKYNMSKSTAQLLIRKEKYEIYN